jgi:hypothetical protein
MRRIESGMQTKVLHHQMSRASDAAGAGIGDGLLSCGGGIGEGDKFLHRIGRHGGMHDQHVAGRGERSKSAKNGVLPKVKPQDLEKLFDDAERGANATLSVDLEKQEIRGPDGGLDDIGLTTVKKDKIERFEQISKSARACQRYGCSLRTLNASTGRWKPLRSSLPTASNSASALTSACTFASTRIWPLSA